MMRTKRAWVNLLFLAAALAVNAMGSLGWFNGMTQEDVSDKYITLITPAPAAFSIWGVIYSLLVLSVIAMIIKKNDRYFRDAIDEISILFRISCLLNMAWIVSFSFLQIGLSSVIIFGFLITLLLIGRKLRKFHQAKRWLLPLTFGFYSGWLLIAAVINVAMWMVQKKWSGFGLAPQIWGIIMLAVSVGLAFLVLKTNKNASFPLPIAWGYLGIYQFLTSPEGFQGQYGMLQTAALAGMAVLICLAGIQLYQNRFRLVSNT